MNWKLTPTEPDDGMIEVAEEMILERIQFGCTVYAADVYDTMLSAAPDPLEDAELVERVALALAEADHAGNDYRDLARAAITAMKGE